MDRMYALISLFFVLTTIGHFTVKIAKAAYEQLHLVNC